MLESGEEPRFLLRRMVIFASEDIGNADPRALGVAIDALRAFELVGLPEGVLPMTQAAIFLALAPKSNTVLTSYGNARKAVLEKGPLPVPMKLRNAPTPLMKSMGYSGGYKYPHNFEGHYVAEQYLPDELAGQRFVELSDSGEEPEMRDRLDQLRAQPTTDEDAPSKK
jgi:putative ATPase